ncbi:MAG: NFACT family protein [Clostridia bacterium]|nr:NFACT family protein [Clostridia bacterium]
MAFDGITLYSVINELKTLVGGKVNQVHQPNNSNITFNIYSKKNYLLNIDTSANNYRIHISNHTNPNPYKAPNFCMLLRKYLIGAKIKRIYMKNLERICYIDFDCFNEMNDMITRTLIIELMGKYSNIVLLNEKHIIIDALKKFDTKNPFEQSHSSARSIMPARKYIEPQETKTEIQSISLDQFKTIISESEYKTLETAIPNLFTGISKMFIQGSLEKLHLSNTIGHKNLIELFNYINDILSAPSLAYCDNFKNNYNIYCSKEKTDKFSNNLKINNFLDEYYFEKNENEIFYQYRNNLLKVLSGTLDKLTNKLNNINNKIKSCENMDIVQLYGELLIANIYRFQNIHDDYVEVENYSNNNEIIKINIDSNLSISQNAEKYFKKYNKMKNTLRIAEIQKKETNLELKYLETLINQLDYCDSIDEVDSIYNKISENILFSDIKFKKKNNTKKYKQNENSLTNYMKLKIDNFDVYIGKNNKQNDYLTTRVASDNDYWFHTKDIHGSHLILRCNGEMPKLSTIKQCAKLASYYSKAKFSSHVPVDYTLVKNVKKPHGAVPGYVIYTNNKTIFVEPESAAVYE